MLACKLCGCTEAHACQPFGCAWVSRRPAVCSACFAFLMNLRDEVKLGRVLDVFELGPWPALIADVNKTGPGW